MQKTPYVFPIIGGRKVEHLSANLDALEISLTPEHIKRIEEVKDFDPGFPMTMVVSTFADFLYRHFLYYPFPLLPISSIAYSFTAYPFTAYPTTALFLCCTPMANSLFRDLMTRTVGSLRAQDIWSRDRSLGLSSLRLPGPRGSRRRCVWAQLRPNMYTIVCCQNLDFSSLAHCFVMRLESSSPTSHQVIKDPWLERLDVANSS